MTVQIPTEEDLKNRITSHLKLRNSSDNVSLIWHGYIASLLEWGLIEPETYGRLLALLPEVGKAELLELFAGTATQEE